MQTEASSPPCLVHQPVELAIVLHSKDRKPLIQVSIGTSTCQKADLYKSSLTKNAKQSTQLGISLVKIVLPFFFFFLHQTLDSAILLQVTQPQHLDA